MDFGQEAARLEAESKRKPPEVDVLSSVLYPKVYEDFAKRRQQLGDISVLPTMNFFYGLQAGEEIAIEIERGKTLIVRYLTTGDVHEDGTRTVFFELNGQPRNVSVVDRSVEFAVKRHAKVDPADPNQIPAPMPGKVSTVAAKAGDTVKAGDRLLSIEAMKMETPVNVPRNAVVAEVRIAAGGVVAAGDLLVVLAPLA